MAHSKQMALLSQQTAGIAWRSRSLPGCDGTVVQVYLSTDPLCRTPCLLLHGSGDGAFIWNEVAAELNDLCDLVALDLRGHGNSQWAAGGDYRLQTHVTDVKCAIDALGLDSFFLIGHSLGGQIGIHIAHAYGERVRGMVLADSGPELSAAGREVARDNLKGSFQIYRSAHEYARRIGSVQSLVPAERIARLAPEALRPCDGGFRLKTDPAIVDSDSDCDEAEDLRLWKMLAEILCPVLVLRGFGSAMLSRHTAERITRTLPRGTLKTLPQAGHALMMDNPVQFAQFSRNFLARLITAMNPRSR
jgi:pimeloyl-ACP methyl ester carboxylesterase